MQVPFIRGGSEVLAEDLRRQLDLAGHEAEIVAVPWEGDGADAALAGIEAVRNLDLERLAGGPIDRVIGLKFPAYLVRHPRKAIWLVHQHRAAYELWDSPSGLIHAPDGQLCRAAIHAADRETFAEGTRVFAISHTVAGRLARDPGCTAEVLYPPPPRTAEPLSTGTDFGYFYFPSRLTPTKRHSLVLRALAACRRPCRLVLSGAADAASVERDLLLAAESLGVTDRIEWRGRVDDRELRALYAGCRAVVFPPFDEDYGYVTLEAMLARKPVVTCSDSGGPLEFIEDGRNGLVTAPEPEALGAALDRLHGDPALAQTLGEAGWRTLRELDLAWPAVLDALLPATP